MINKFIIIFTTVLFSISNISVSQADANGTNWVQQNAPANKWNDVIYGYEDSKFVAVGENSTNAIMTSPDGITWTAINNSITPLRGIAYGDGKFVVVGGTGKGLISEDGVSWTEINLPTATWKAVTFGNGLFTAVSSCSLNVCGYSARIATSPNGIDWTIRLSTTANSGGETVRPFTDVKYLNAEKFIAVSSLNQVWSSTDGINWDAGTIPSGQWFGVDYGNEKYVAAPWAGIPAESNDGLTFTLTSAPAYINMRDVSFGNGLFVFVGKIGAGTVVTTPDLINWTAQSSAPIVDNSITHGNGLFVAVGSSDGSFANAVMTSGLFPPESVSATAGDGQATVSWTVPLSDGGNSITSYSVSSSPGNLTCTTSVSTSCTVTGLTNGVDYFFYVTAINLSGSNRNKTITAVSPNSRNIGSSNAGSSTTISQPIRINDIFIVKNPGKVSTAYVQNLRGDQISSIAPDQIKKFALKAFNIFSPAQVSNFTNDQLTSLSPRQVRNFKPSVFSVFSELQIKSLQPNDFRALNGNQISKISGLGSRGIEKNDLKSLSLQQLRSFRPSSLSQIQPEVLKILSPDYFKNLTRSQKNALTQDQKSQLSREQLRAIK